MTIPDPSYRAETILGKLVAARTVTRTVARDVVDLDDTTLDWTLTNDLVAAIRQLNVTAAAVADALAAKGHLTADQAGLVHGTSAR